MTELHNYQRILTKPLLSAAITETPRVVRQLQKCESAHCIMTAHRRPLRARTSTAIGRGVALTANDPRDRITLSWLVILYCVPSRLQANTRGGLNTL